MLGLGISSQRSGFSMVVLVYGFEYAIFYEGMADLTVPVLQVGLGLESFGGLEVEVSVAMVLGSSGGSLPWVFWWVVGWSIGCYGFGCLRVGGMIRKWKWYLLT